MTNFIKIIFMLITLPLSGCAYPSPQSNDSTHNLYLVEQTQNVQLNQYRHSSEPSTYQQTTQKVAKFITIGSSKQEVAEIQGTPKSIDNSEFPEVWYYNDFSSITFRNGKVDEWNNHGSLKVSLTGATFKNIESHQNNTMEKASVGENGSYYGEISTKTGRPKTTYVNGYYRKDGTYVRGHYRS